MSMIKLVHLTKIYRSKENVAIGIQDINLDFNSGEFVAIVGSSGSGKTTLLNVISGMDSYEEGELFIGGKSTSDYTIEDFENYRRANVAFIFQNYQLIDSYTVLENVMVELMFKGFTTKEAKARAKEILAKVGLSHRLKNRASKLSGGEKQRVVIARAIASNAQILVCDEPTGNLDSKTSLEIMKLLKDLSKDKLVLFVTHDESLIENNATRIIKIKDGKVESDREIVQVEKTSREIEKAGENKLFTKIFVAFKNVVRTPRKSFFILIVFTILSFVLMNAIAYLPTQIKEIDVITTEYNTFVNRDDNRVIVYPKDKQNIELSEEAIVFEQDYYLDIAYRVGTFEGTINRFIQPASYVKASMDNLEVIAGEVPTKPNEVLLILGDSYSETFYETAVGADIRFGVSGIQQFYKTPYIISGVGGYTKEYIEKEKLNNNSSSSNTNAAAQLYDTTDFYMIPEGLQSLFKDTRETFPKQVLSSSVDDFIFVSNNKNYAINIKDYGDDRDQKLRVSYRYKDIPYTLKLGLQEIDLSNYEIEYVFTNLTSYSIEMSSAVALEIIEANPYRYSVYAKDEMLTNLGVQLSQNDATVYVLRDLKKEQLVYDISAITNNLIYFAFLVAGILVSLFVVTIITSFVLGTKKKELGVLRVIGLSEKDVLNVLHFELLFLMSLSIVITIVFAFVTTIVELPFEFGLFFDNKIKLIASILVLLIMGYFISLGWNKRMFKKSAREVLKVGDSL